MKIIEVKIQKGQKHCVDKHGHRYRINGLLIKKDRGGEILYTIDDNEHFCGIYSKGDFYKAAVKEGTYQHGFLLDRNLINLI